VQNLVLRSKRGNVKLVGARGLSRLKDKTLGGKEAKKKLAL